MLIDTSKITPHYHRKTPYKHQEDTFKSSRNDRYFGLFWEMGTGKSKVMVDTAQHLYIKQEIDGVLVFSDKGCYLTWYYEEFPKHLMPEIDVRMAAWVSGGGRRQMEGVEKLYRAVDNKLDILCMNVEALNSDKAFRAAEKFVTSHYCMIIVDESTSIKNPKAERTKRIMHLGQRCDYRRICTGTPITASPLDLFSQCQFLQFGSLGHKSFVTFRSEFAVMRPMPLSNGRTIQVIEGYRNLEELTKRIQPFTSRVLKSECLDLPDSTDSSMYVTLTVEQQQAYDKLKSEAVLQLDQGLLTSTSALTTINKLQQICCGHVKLNEGQVVDLPSNRVPSLISYLEIIGEKCVIWCAFQRDVEQIIAAIQNKFTEGELYPVHYYGKTTAYDRMNALQAFRDDPKCQWFVSTAATGGKGINELVVARHVAYYSYTYNLEDYLQSRDRTMRIGQTRDVTYMTLTSPGTVDVKILQNLRGKRDVASQVLDEFRQLIS